MMKHANPLVQKADSPRSRSNTIFRNKIADCVGKTMANADVFVHLPISV